MKKIAFLCCLCFGLFSNAQKHEVGVIVDSLSVGTGTSETFTLYLPTTYNPKKLSPVLFIFSPSGNGKMGVSIFKKAAETYNYILICSNDSRNGPYERNLPIAERLFNHVFSNFNIDENRINLAGFSGGSRLASTIATLSGQINGVIACGAGFSSAPAYRPSTQDFLYAALCGNRDMNYNEMIKAIGYLDRLKFRNSLFTFDGNHRWPPEEQIFMAFEWFEIEAHKKQHLKMSDTRLKSSFTTHYAKITAKMITDEPLQAAERYGHLLKTYGSFYNLDSIQNQYQKLTKTKAYTKTLNSRKKAFEREIILNKRLFEHYMKDYENPENADMGWWEKEFKKLDKLSANAQPEMIKMLERVQYNLFAGAYERIGSNTAPTVAQKKFRKAILSEMKSRLFKEKPKKKVNHETN